MNKILIYSQEDLDLILELEKQENEELQQENQKLKKQLDYLRSGEYYNQLRFENEMLQQVVDTNGVPSEVYDYIDCTHRNTELLKENQKYKEVIDKVSSQIKLYGKYNGEKCTRGFSVMTADFNKLLEILKEVE